MELDLSLFIFSVDLIGKNKLHQMKHGRSMMEWNARPLPVLAVVIIPIHISNEINGVRDAARPTNSLQNGLKMLFQKLTMTERLFLFQWVVPLSEVKAYLNLCGMVCITAGLRI